jgi:hypothetical protein
LEAPESYHNVQIVNIDRIVGPAFLVPDLGNPKRGAYLQLLPMSGWADLFNKWLAQPHTRNFDTMRPRIAEEEDTHGQRDNNNQVQVVKFRARSKKKRKNR